MALRFGRALFIISHLLHVLIDHTTLAQTTPEAATIITSDASIITNATSIIANVTTPSSFSTINGMTSEGNLVSGTTDSVDNITQPPKIDVNSAMIEVDTIDELTVKFKYKSREYLFINIKVMHDFAEIMCSSYYLGALATIPNLEVAKFLAIALSETNLELESLWVGGKNTSNGNITSWSWIKNNYSNVIDNDIVGLIGNAKAGVDFERNCLAFARADHDEPQFKILNCLVNRAFMCERAVGQGGKNDTTHPGWIGIGNRLFKIFRDQVDYHTASINCVNANENASLAVVGNMEEVRQLARYLLIGRPSLENAWIGARWIENRYQFENDHKILLDNITNITSKFPPWRNGSMKIAGGCLLLDRHLADNPLFIETRCHRLRPYICSRLAYNSSLNENRTETLLDGRLYFAYFTKQSWEKARSICITDNAKLVEPEDTNQVEELLFIMGQNVSTFSHIWLGGQYVNDTWIWISTQQIISKDTLPFVQNNTYIQNIEKQNTCLNLDRENHIVGLFYGTNCFFPQHFICRANSMVFS